MAQLSRNWPIITSDWWLELICKSLTMVELRVEWVMVGGEKPGPASHQPPHIRGWPSRGRSGPRWETEGVLFCVLPSVVLRSWPGEEAGVRGQGWTDVWPGDMRRVSVPVLCVLCVRWHRASCTVIMNYWKRRYLLPGSVSSLAIFYPCVLLPDNLIPSCRTLLHFLTLKSEARTEERSKIVR